MIGVDGWLLASGSASGWISSVLLGTGLFGRLWVFGELGFLGMLATSTGGLIDGGSVGLELELV